MKIVDKLGKKENSQNNGVKCLDELMACTWKKKDMYKYIESEV